MLAAVRAELLVLRKWPAAWALLLVTPLVTLASSYLSTFITYLTVTPAQYLQAGAPDQILPSMLPSQFVIAATAQFGTTGVVPFAVLGAVLAGGDWDRGTIRTSMLQRPGRVRTFGGQVLALAAAIAASVVVTFLLCAAVSLLIAKAEARVVLPGDAAMPGIGTILRGLGADTLISLAYGTGGLALGTVLRSAAGAIAATLLWTVIVEGSLYNMASQAGGLFLRIANFLPASSANALSFMFFKASGSAVYLPLSPERAAWTMAGYIAAFVGGTALLVHRRDITARRRVLRGGHAPPPPDPAAPAVAAVPAAGGPARARPRVAGWLSAATGCLHAELLVLRKRRAVWALAAVLPANMMISVYATGYVYYRTAAHGLTAGVDPQQVLSAMSPSHYLSAPLFMLGIFSGAYGATVFALMGALVAGSDWGRHTVRTALLQGPGRLAARIGQDLAVLIATTTSVLAAFALAAGTSAVGALFQAGALAPGDGRYPSFAELSGAVGGALILCLTYTAIGLTLGTLLRSDTAAAGVIVLWTVIVGSSLDNIYTWHGALLALYKLLPDASVNTISNLYNSVTGSIPGMVIRAPSGVQVMPVTAVLTLGLYLIVCLALPAMITRRRDIT